MRSRLRQWSFFRSLVLTVKQILKNMILLCLQKVNLCKLTQGSRVAITRPICADMRTLNSCKLSSFCGRRGSARINYIGDVMGSVEGAELECNVKDWKIGIAKSTTFSCLFWATTFVLLRQSRWSMGLWRHRTIWHFYDSGLIHQISEQMSVDQWTVRGSGTSVCALLWLL